MHWHVAFLLFSLQQRRKVRRQLLVAPTAGTRSDHGNGDDGLTSPDHGGLDGNGIKLLQVFNQLLIFCPDPRFLEGMHICHISVTFVVVMKNELENMRDKDRCRHSFQTATDHNMFSLNVSCLKHQTSVSFPSFRITPHKIHCNTFSSKSPGTADAMQIEPAEKNSLRAISCNHFQSLRIFHFIPKFLHENHPNSHEPSYSRLTGTS